MRKILSYLEAQQILAPYLQKLAAAIQQGFSDYLQLRHSAAQNIGYVEYEVRAKATLVHEHIKNRIQEAFNGIEGVETGKWNGIFGLKINDELFIRFKKFKPDFSLSGTPTKQFKGYQKQLMLDGFPDEPTFLIAGYIPDVTWTGLAGIHIVCRIGEQNYWELDLLNGTSAVQGRLFIEDEKPEHEPRVKTKNLNESDTKTGTDG